MVNRWLLVTRQVDDGEQVRFSTMTELETTQPGLEAHHQADADRQRTGRRHGEQ